ncbi:MAG: metal-dependent hydrolase [Betaproteobacteria bacterium]|nr:metal-dependent hydrolase [Betaproteobacteria bacterium]
MDTLTHALSGALVARLIVARGPVPLAALPGVGAAGRFGAAWGGGAAAPLPWQGVAVGVVAGAFPDIDIVARSFGDVAYLLHHRGITHSLLLLPLWAWGIAALMALAFRVTRGQRGGWKSLYVFACAGIGIHIAGDWITQFGTMLLAPVSNQRFGLGSMFIIDLAFTGTLLAGLALAAVFPRRRWPAGLGLGAAAAWVGLATVGQFEALDIGERHARALGVAAPVVTVMPRPASPFNWTVTVFDGQRYHVAHVNTRRSEALQADADSHFLRRFSAPYLPAGQAVWQTVPRFGEAGTPAWVQEAWNAEPFAFYRWFAQTPALLQVQQDADGERCAWFRDLRFEFPGREEGPFRYGVCLPGVGQGAGAPARVFKLEDGQRQPV